MFNKYRVFAAYLIAIPLALILGVLASSPDELTLMLIGMLLFFLALPAFIKWHHALLIFLWNSAFSANFLPGEPAFWLMLAGLSFGLSVLNHVMGRRPFRSVPEMTTPLLLLAAVVIGTAFYRGGIGIRILGGAAHGGKNYIYVLGAIIGFFALTAGEVPIHKSRKMAGLYFVSGTSYALSNLIYTLGPAFYSFYYVVPAIYAVGQAQSELGSATVDRISGFAPACIAGLSCLLVRYGVRGLCDWYKPWRFVFLCLTVGAGLFAGFRSALVLLFLIFVFQFCLEGLLRTRLFPILTGLAIGGFVAVALCAGRLPTSVQRTISFLPVNVDSAIRADAVGTVDWRLQMWSEVWQDAPKYLMVGKGYSIDPAEMDATLDAIQLGMLNNYEERIVAGDYHSGPLSVIIPFGIAGSVAFLWVLTAGFRVLYSNYRYGDARLHRINAVLLSYYAAQVVCFLFVYGSLSNELFTLLGPVGLGISLNGGMKKKPRSEFLRESLPQRYAMEVE
ncbi:MAG: hypothetical protein ACLQU4_13165 [Limisphaerales bacterium]